MITTICNTCKKLEFKMCYKYCKYSKDSDSKYLFGHVSKNKA